MSQDQASAPAPSNLIYVAGNIAAGKSTFCRLLQQALGASLVEENVGRNPYLDRFYTDMARWSFHVDVHFLTLRGGAVRREFRPGGAPAVFDRCYLEGSVFAAVAYATGQVSAEERATFELLLETFDSLLPPPGVLVYLSAEPPALLRRVADRGRPYEHGMSLDYLRALQEEYERWFETYERSPKIRVETGPADLRSDLTTARSIADEIAAYVR
ncbi:MAG TPA: deoxynucleoside kinase [Trebonia sp.]